MIRKLQNIGATFGIVSSAAASFCAGVASTTFAVYFLSSNPKPRSALWRSNSARVSALRSPRRSF
jgi:hypothetical protein